MSVAVATLYCEQVSRIYLPSLPSLLFNSMCLLFDNFNHLMMPCSLPGEMNDRSQLFVFQTEGAILDKRHVEILPQTPLLPTPPRRINYNHTYATRALIFLSQVFRRQRTFCTVYNVSYPCLIFFSPPKAGDYPT